MKQKYFWENEAVRLRTLAEEDAESLYTAFYKESDLFLGQSREETMSEEDKQNLVAYGMAMTDLQSKIWLAIMDKESHTVGFSILDCFDDRHGTLRLNLVILPEYRGRGFGKHAMHILLSFVFFERRYHKVNAYLPLENRAGCIFLKKMNFSKEGLRKDVFFDGENYRSQYFFGITKEDFETGTSDDWEEKSYEDLSHKIMDKNRKLPEDMKDIVIREMEEEDYFSLRSLQFSSMESRFYDHDVKMPVEEEYLTYDQSEYLENGKREERLEFAVTDLNGKLLGNVNLHSMDRKNQSFSLSFYFLKEERKKGYAKKAVLAMLQYAFCELDFHKMNLCVDEENEASLRLMERLALPTEGRVRESIFYDNHYANEILFGITKEEFLNLYN